ncbi:MAG: hypothetical protein P8Y03_01260 [Anaerolineales bacterium]
MRSFQTVKSETIYQGKVFDVRQDQVRLPNGNLANLDIVEHSGAVTLLPVDNDRQMWFVRQYRHQERLMEDNLEQFHTESIPDAIEPWRRFSWLNLCGILKIEGQGLSRSVPAGRLLRCNLALDLPPADVFSKVFNQVMARGSNSRRPQTSQIQAGKLGTVTSSPFSQVKYVMCFSRMTPAEHSGQGAKDPESSS